MTEEFDHIAWQYDRDFTHTLIGKAQRKMVWTHLLPLEKDTHCLELNCGTGEDALRMCRFGVSVTATDISTEMVSVAQQKLATTSARVYPLDVRQLGQEDMKQQQMVFSNFGGLNCVSPTDWNEFANKLTAHLPGQARVVFVIMGRKCLWERLYFTWKKDKQWVRSGSQPVAAHVDGHFVNTWYYSPSDIKKFMGNAFTCTKTKPVGFMVPPSYLEPFVRRRPKLFSILRLLDRFTCQWSFLSNFADHFYIEFRKQING